MAHKKGNEHWTADCANAKKERDTYLALLKEIHKEAQQAYYCDVMAIKAKIEQVIKGK